MPDKMIQTKAYYVFTHVLYMDVMPFQTFQCKGAVFGITIENTSVDKAF